MRKGAGLLKRHRCDENQVRLKGIFADKLPGASRFELGGNRLSSDGR
jgi:hypothetical protein